MKNKNKFLLNKKVIEAPNEVWYFSLLSTKNLGDIPNISN